MSPKTTQNIKNILSSFWMSMFSKIGMAILLAISGFVLASGRGMVREAVTEQVQDTMAPTVAQINDRLDTMESSGIGRDKRLDTIDKKLDAIIGIMIDVVPGAKMAAKQRAEKEKEAKEVRDALIGGNQ